MKKSGYVMFHNIKINFAIINVAVLGASSAKRRNSTLQLNL